MSDNELFELCKEIYEPYFEKMISHGRELEVSNMNSNEVEAEKQYEMKEMHRKLTLALHEAGELKQGDTQ